MGNHRGMNCRNCAFCRYFSHVREYVCIHDKSDPYMVKGSNSPCEDYLRSRLPAYRDPCRRVYL